MQAKRAYYSPTAFVDMLFKENPSLENNITDIYAYFKPQDAYVDKYQQVCARIIGIIFKRKEKTFNNKPIINPKTGKPINPRTPQQQKNMNYNWNEKYKIKKSYMHSKQESYRDFK